MANPYGQIRAKPFREALNIERKLAEEGQESPALPGSLRYIARQLLVRAGEDNTAAKEVADRIDGKVPQGITGGEDGDLTINFNSSINDLDQAIAALEQLRAMAENSGQPAGDGRDNREAQAASGSQGSAALH